MVSLKNFVDIDIQPHSTSYVSGTRERVVLFTSYLPSDSSAVPGQQQEIDDLSSAKSRYETNSPDTYAYLQVFFNNGGRKALVIEGVETLTAADILALKDEYICIAQVASDENKETNYSLLKSIASSLESDSIVYGVNEKLILASTNSMTVDTDKVKNFISKYSRQQGAEMTIAAYLSQINVYGIDSIFDYAFTVESILSEDVTDSVYKSFIENNVNVDLYLAGAIRECGGNCKDGQDIVNTYVRIILHQTLTERLIQLLSQKIKNSSGVAKIYTTITQELELYRRSGYLSEDKVWTDETLKIGNYTIIEKGTPLIGGYFIKILPFSSLTDEDRQEHKAPQIYVIIADQYSIRKITINGEII